MLIRIRHFRSVLIRIQFRIRIKGFDEQKLKKFQLKIKAIYPQASVKAVQTSGEKPSTLNKRSSSSTSKHEMSSPFFYFCGSFLPSWIRILPTNIIANPVPQHCFPVQVSFILTSSMLSSVLVPFFLCCGNETVTFYRSGT